MALRNRKQIPLCATCHKKVVHPGKYEGVPLIRLQPSKMFDNRIINVESYVKPGIEYSSRPLEERGWKEVKTSSSHTEKRGLFRAKKKEYNKSQDGSTHLSPIWRN